MQKDSIKREQSQAGLSFAERKNFRPQVKNKLLLLLALLMTAATGAWADETLLTTITATGTGSYSETTPGVVTVTHDNDDFDGDYGWLWWENSGSVTVEAKEGYTITKCVFHQTSKSPVTVSTAPFKINFVWDDHMGKFLCEGMDGVSSIEVYGGVAATTYTVSMKDGVKDADKWTITPNPAEEGQTVTLQYNGRLKVKGVKATSEAGAPAANIVDLSTLTADYEAQDGEVLTGTLGANVKISIADGATVTLKNLSINASGTWTSGNHAGITCPGNATISLEGTNTVKGFYEDYPGIHIAKGKTLYIKGSGTLNAIGGGYGAGIGGGYDISCGNIEIQDGTVNAQGGRQAAGIGSGVYYSSSSDCGTITISGGTVNATGGVSASGIGSGDKGTCSDITISGGTVNAKGGDNNSGTGTGAGIGSGKNGTCGDITIANTVTKVTATSSDAPHSIGKGTDGTCGTVTIGGTKYWENNAAVNGGDTYLAQATIIYDPTAAAKPAATVTTAPTGAAVVGVKKTTALVSGGVADGGTLWYAVTTTNTKPTSTAGFSDAVPTAENIKASGKVYVWYYVKGDDTHSDSEIAATAIEVPVAIIWDGTNVTDLEVYATWTSYTKEGVTLSGNADGIQARYNNEGDPTFDGISFETFETGGFTFTAPTGKAFTKIEMKVQGPGGWLEANLGTGWVSNPPTVTWKGSAAASTVKLLTDESHFHGENIASIVFYLSE